MGLACAAVMTLALVSPVRELDTAAFSAALAGYGEDAALLAGEAESESGELERTIIERECAAYILDKAAGLGASGLTADVTACRAGASWTPDSASLTGDIPEPARRELAALISSELGIPPERQYWNAG